jgi:hypothetical protein
MPPTLTGDVVRNEVARYWNLFSSKSALLQEEFYASECSVIPFRSVRPEPARLAAKRRQREYYAVDSALKVQVGLIDVVLVNEAVAVASYTFVFHAEKIVKPGQGAIDYHYEHGRATQVFGYDHEGRLRIFHEHLSIPADEAGNGAHGGSGALG